jgi:sterol desaturase/sphingolipid hydroxylase (fatty acid hydroxylase superfamily)
MAPLSSSLVRIWPHLVYPVVFGVGLGASAWAHRVGESPLISVSAVLVGMGIFVWMLEWWMPHSPRWQPSRRTFGLDLVHSLLSSGAVSRLVEATLLAGLVGLRPWMFGDAAGWLWPTQWPTVVQLVLALSVGELGAYWAHRLCHRTDLGWRVHAVHHSLEQLHWLAAGRTHPLNAVWVFSCQMAPLILLGVPAEIWGMVAVFTGLNGYLQHANTVMKPGPFSWIISTCELHRWHHSRDCTESDTNFGNNLIIWDRVFGTCFRPSNRPSPLVLGIAETAIPENFWTHLATPWRLGDVRWARRN